MDDFEDSSETFTRTAGDPSLQIGIFLFGARVGEFVGAGVGDIVGRGVAVVPLNVGSAETMVLAFVGGLVETGGDLVGLMDGTLIGLVGLAVLVPSVGSGEALGDIMA